MFLVSAVLSAGEMECHWQHLSPPHRAGELPVLEQCRMLSHTSLCPDPVQEGPGDDLLFCSKVPGLCCWLILKAWISAPHNTRCPLIFALLHAYLSLPLSKVRFMVVDKIRRLLHLGVGKQNIVKSQAGHEWKENGSPGKVQCSGSPSQRCLCRRSQSHCSPLAIAG